MAARSTRLSDPRRSAFARATSATAARRIDAARERQRRENEDAEQQALRISFYDWAVRIPEPKTGKLDFERFPFQVELYRDAADAHDMCVIKATQIGVSAYLIRWVLYWSDVRGYTAIYVLPKSNLADNFSDTRIKPLIDGSAYLSGRIPRGYVQNKVLKQIGLGFMFLRGSESTDGLETIDADLLALDEYDKLVAANIAIVKRRLSAAIGGGMTRAVSTPSVPGFGVDALFRKSDMRYWFVKCGSCGARQPVFFTPEHDDAEGVVNGYVDKDRALVVCGACHKPLDVAQGEWVARHPERAARGYHASRLIVPGIARNDYGALGSIILASELTDAFERQSFYNRDLGEAWAESEGRLSLATIQAAQRDDVVMQDGYVGENLVTMGVDVASVRALNVRVSEHIGPRTKRALWIGQVDSFDELYAKVEQFRPHMIAIDHLPEGRLARGVCERYPGRAYRVAFAQNQKVLIAVDDVERLITVRRVESIDAMMGMIREQRNLLPAQLPEGYAGELQAPVRYVEKDDTGKLVVGYRSSGSDDYALMETYDMIAKEAWIYRQTVGGLQEGEMTRLEDRVEFQRAHLNDADQAEDEGFMLGPEESEGGYSPGFTEDYDDFT